MAATGGTTANITLTANYGPLANMLRAAGRLVSSFATGAAASMSKLSAVHKNPGKKDSWVPHALGQVAGTVAMRGIDMLVDQGKKVFDFNEQLVRFGIASRKGGQELLGVGEAIRQVAAETGVDSAEVLRGTRSYVDMAGAAAYSTQKMSLLARTSQATKADIGELTQVVYQMQHAMHISDTDLEDSLGGVINMSKDGAVHFNQMAQEIAELAPQAARYGMVGRKGINELTAMMQVARTGFASASEMGTGITRVFSGLTMHASKFKKYGVEVFNVGKDGTKTWRKFSDIFQDIRTNNILAKDPELLRKAFGRSEADRTIRLWMEGVEELKKLEEQGLMNGVVQKDLATYTESAAGRIAQASEKMKNAFAAALTPDRVDQIVGGIQSIADAMPAIMTAVGKVSDAFGAFVHAISRAKQALTGDSKLQLSNEEAWDLNRYMEAQHSGHVMTPEIKAKGEAVLKRKADYDSAIGDIMGSESDFGATDESIKKAIRYALPDKAGPEGKQGPGSPAGMAYLEARSKEISEARYKRLKAEVEAEREKSMTPYAITQQRYQQAEREDKAKEAAQAAFVAQHITPLVQGLATRIGDAVAKAVGTKPTVVAVDGNPIARAAGNATDARRR